MVAFEGTGAARLICASIMLHTEWCCWWLKSLFGSSSSEYIIVPVCWSGPASYGPSHRGKYLYM